MKLKTKSKIDIEPLYKSLFIVEFFSDRFTKKECKLLSDLVTSVQYYENKSESHGHINFNLNIIKGEIQPLAILDRLKFKHRFDIDILGCSKNGDILQKVKMINCKISHMDGLESLDYEDDSIMNLSVDFLCKRIKKKLYKNKQ